MIPKLTRLRISFKRKRKLPAGLSLPKFLSPFPRVTPQVYQNQPLPTARSRKQRDIPSNDGSDISLNLGGGPPGESTSLNYTKDVAGLDWYLEGPGRRVGYDDLTAIDWIFEYTKERQRLRALYSQAVGLFGYARQLYDASQVWLILIGAGLASGLLAASIDVASDWLGDLKTGYCRNGPGGGRFYLNKNFCCWGHQGILVFRCLKWWDLMVFVEWSQCQDWTSWSSALHVRSSGGRYFVSYLFFITYSVRTNPSIRLGQIEATMLRLSQVFFAVCASILVRDYAPYAKHSGIPEIKTVLGGFIIRRFMGLWTLIVKSLGLVTTPLILRYAVDPHSRLSA